MNKTQINNITVMDYALLLKPNCHSQWDGGTKSKVGSLGFLVPLPSTCVFLQRSLHSPITFLYSNIILLTSTRWLIWTLIGTNTSFIKLTSTLLSLAHENESNPVLFYTYPIASIKVALPWDCETVFCYHVGIRWSIICLH